ncbi:hypothetical protein D3C71_1714510 [compost metagenome]
MNRPGSWAWAAWLMTRATMGKPRALAVLSRVMTRAAAPSEIEEALAAVMAPSLVKAGRRVGILAGSALPGCSSSLIVTEPLRVATSTGTISALKAPEAMAAWARVRLSMAYSSICSRVN